MYRNGVSICSSFCFSLCHLAPFSALDGEHTISSQLTTLKNNSIEGCQMAGVCGGVWRGDGKMMGVDKGWNRRKQEEAKIGLFLAFQLLFS